MSTPTTSLLPKDTLLHSGSYRIVKHIGSGGFGNTYEGLHLLLGRRVAIKEFFPKDFCMRDADTNAVRIITESRSDLLEKLRGKFLDEARALCALHHPGIVKVHDVFEENGTAYFVMDYVSGESLEDKLGKYGALSEKEALGYIRQVADALAHVHAQNRLHLDIKPNNIMVDEQGHTVLIDFGASKYYDENSGKNVSTVVGFTPGFAPSEQADNDIKNFSPATDIYALGATLYRLLANVTPPSAAAIATEEEELKPLPAHISAATRKAVTAAMQFARKKRPQSIAEFLELLGESKVAPPPPGDSKKTKVLKGKDSEGSHPSPVPNKWLLPLIGVIAVLVIVLIGVLTCGGISDEEGGQNDSVVKAVPTKVVADGRNTAITPTATPVTQTPAAGEDNKTTEALANTETPASTIATSTTTPSADKPTETNPEPPQSAVVRYDAASNAIVYGSHSYKMVYVSGGTFTMGATAGQGDDAYDDEKPAHQVTLSGYYMGRTEVPQWLWMAVMGSNPSNWQGDNLPVENVSWNNCQTFISKLNSLTGKNFRLPTEAQWEFAARGGNRSRGYKYSGSDNLGSVAWYDGNSGNRTHNVGTKNSNELGLYDMSGNVWEWCSDAPRTYSDYAQTNPVGSGSYRVYRGGSWFNYARSCRVSHRSSRAPSDRDRSHGLRLAL